MKIGEWWFIGQEKFKKEMLLSAFSSSDVLLKMVKEGLLTDKAHNGGGYTAFGPQIKDNGEIWWECQLDNNERFFYRIFPEALSLTEQLIIASTWPKEDK